MNDDFNFLIDNWCDNALDLINNQLIVNENLPYGIHCQWLIYTAINNGFITLEFSNITVRKL